MTGQRRRSGCAALAALLGAALSATIAQAGPWEDGMVAYNRGDYLPAIALFSPLARAGRADAQKILARIYHRHDKDKVRALMWWDVAAALDDSEAIAERDALAATMTAGDVARARARADTCLATHYKSCD